MPAKRRRVLAALVIGAAATGGCGGSTEADRVLDSQTSSAPLTAEDRLIERKLVVAKDVAKAPSGSAQRAFLDYWSAISFEDWATAVQSIDVNVRRELEPGYLVNALRIEGRDNVPVKPLIRSTAVTRAGTSVRYFVRAPDGKLRPTSSTWRRRNGLWYLVYSSMLDDSYGAAVQLAIQNDINPKAKEAATRAISQGRRATRDQARTLRPSTP